MSIRVEVTLVCHWFLMCRERTWEWKPSQLRVSALTFEPNAWTCFTVENCCKDYQDPRLPPMIKFGPHWKHIQHRCFQWTMRRGYSTLRETAVASTQKLNPGLCGSHTLYSTIWTEAEGHVKCALVPNFGQSWSGQSWNPETQSWRYKTIIVIKRQQQITVSNNRSLCSLYRFCTLLSLFWYFHLVFLVQESTLKLLSIQFWL